MILWSISDLRRVAQLSPEPGADETSSEQVRDDVPVVRDRAEGHSAGPERQGGCHHHKAHRLVQNDGFEHGNTKGSDQQREPEFRAAEPYRSAERADQGTTAKRGKAPS